MVHPAATLPKLDFTSLSAQQSADDPEVDFAFKPSVLPPPTYFSSQADVVRTALAELERLTRTACSALELAATDAPVSDFMDRGYFNGDLCDRDDYFTKGVPFLLGSGLPPLGTPFGMQQGCQGHHGSTSDLSSAAGGCSTHVLPALPLGVAGESAGEIQTTVPIAQLPAPQAVASPGGTITAELAMFGAKGNPVWSWQGLSNQCMSPHVSSERDLHATTSASMLPNGEAWSKSPHWRLSSAPVGMAPVVIGPAATPPSGPPPVPDETSSAS